MTNKYKHTKTSYGYYETTPKPTEEELQIYYHDKYYQEGLGSYQIQYTEDEILYFKNRLDRHYYIVKPFLKTVNDPNFLDIGAGEGFTAKYFADKNLSPESIDYSSAGIKQQNPELLSTHEEGNIFNLLSQKITMKRKYNLLILQNVLEHVIDPSGLCMKMEKLLSDDGICLITIPNDYSEMQLNARAKNMIQNEFWLSPPEHLQYFNCTNISHFLSAQNWEILDMITDFPVDIYYYNENSNYINNPAKGKRVHKARVEIENLMHKRPLIDVVKLCRAMAKVGIGRNITLVARPNPG